MSGVGKYESGILRQLPNPIYIMPHKALWGVGVVAQVGTNGRVFLTAYYTPFPITLTRCNYASTVLGGAGTFVRLGVYASASQVNPTPDGGALLWDSGNLPADSVLQKDVAITPNVTVNGWFYMALETNDATIQFTRTTGIVIYSEQGGSKLRGTRFDQAFGALPATVPVTTIDDTANVIASFVYV
jgi:hypothetical protein